MHVYSALMAPMRKAAGSGCAWMVSPPRMIPSFTELAEKSGIPEQFIASVRSVVQPGTTMVLTEKPVDSNTQSKPGFKIMGLGEVAER